jgi:hypothetical protein
VRNSTTHFSLSAENIKKKPGVRKNELPVFFVFSDYLDSETLVELPTLDDVVLLPQAVAIAATIATTATKAKIFFMSLISLQ